MLSSYSRLAERYKTIMGYNQTALGGLRCGEGDLSHKKELYYVVRQQRPRESDRFAIFCEILVSSFVFSTRTELLY
jgi:hypothetical protein